MKNDQVLKILFVEDVPEDLELAKRKIKDYGIRFEICLARNENEFLEGLYEFKPDIIISDYFLSEFDGMRALEYSLTYDNTVPFIILTGFINEEIAVATIKAGATDYVLKERINRLPIAIKEAIKKKDVLLENKYATEFLEFMSKIIEQSPYSIISTDVEGIVTSWNKGAERIFGFTHEEAVGKHISIIYHNDDLEILNKDIIEPLLSKKYLQKQIRLKNKKGESLIGSLSLWTIEDITGQAVQMVGHTLDITKTVKAQEELQIKNQAIDSNIDGMALLELDGTISYVNRSALKMWGYESKEEVIGKKVEEFFDTQYDRTEILEIMKDPGFKSERRALRKDGTVFPAWVSTTIIKDHGGKPVAFMGSIIDVTEKRKTEDALMESEKKYRLLAENTLNSIWLMDMNMVFTYVNPSIHSMFGYLPEEWIGSKLSDHCDEENFTMMMNYMKKGFAGTDSPGVAFQAEMLKKNGDKIPVEILAKVVRGDDGLPVAINGTTRDITERIVAEESLKESEERLKLAMMASEQGFWDWDLLLDEFYFSPNSYTMLGYQDKEFSISPQIWEKLIHPADRKDIIPEIVKSVKEGKSFSSEIRMLSKSGKWRWILAKGAIFNEKKGTKRAIGTFADITESKNTEEQMLLARIAAEEANRCKNELLANMNHELRTPLNSVIGYSDVMMDQDVGELNAEQRKYLQRINDAGYKLLALINNVLDLAQIESNGVRLMFSAFDPVEYVEEVVRATRKLALEKKIIVNTNNIDENVTEVTADAGKFKEIVYNLLENAYKFTPENGTVSISIKIEDEDLEVFVEDTGIGIADADKERIFNPFVQVDGSNTRRYGGSGLGLVLVNEYLKMQSGNIWVESEPGKGSKFIFRIPIYPKERATDV